MVKKDRQKKEEILTTKYEVSQQEKKEPDRQVEKERKKERHCANRNQEDQIQKAMIGKKFRKKMLKEEDTERQRKIKTTSYV